MKRQEVQCEAKGIRGERIEEDEQGFHMSCPKKISLPKANKKIDINFTL